MTKAARLITVEVALRDSVIGCEGAIRARLQRYGRPLNWIVTDVDVKQQTATIDALIVN